ncbi:uroporphyrinogen decarboxylase family protein [Opitutales bacterium ASA1]|uniref:uroporphyrinogen decarboxylase family protein n=1 Tax=Congregicoccus parvus TaxID=3081749 RepID=UPI002B2D9D5B|nr:uroporphyrinogen decarboxylase family protein [Opitutales bacterium ASA1]
MPGRERILRALRHDDGPVPIDLGGTGVTSMHASCVEALRCRFGLEQRPVKIVEPFQMLGEIEPDLCACLGSDAIGISGRTTLFGFANEGWREWRAPWGQVVLVPEGFRVRRDAAGDVFVYPGGDETLEPSGHMPAGAYFFDCVSRQQPLDYDRLDPEDNCEEFVPISALDVAHWRSEVARVKGDPHAVVASFGGTGFGDIALVPGPFLARPRGIRDVSEWYMALVENRDYVHAVFTRQCEVALKNLAVFAEIAGDVVDVLFVCGTDFGTQTSQFCSAATFEELYAPYYRRVNAWVHAHTRWKTFKHCCGAIRPLIPNFIEAGFDVLNPVQCSATGMEPKGLKRDFGDRIVFWGGGVDTQKTLPFGTPEQVRREVEERLRVFGAGGGFVFNTVHNIQARTPVENIVAMLETVHAFNRAGG